MLEYSRIAGPVVTSQLMYNVQLSGQDLHDSKTYYMVSSSELKVKLPYKMDS